MKARKNREGFFMTLGERLTALRKGAGLSQEQMAAELNVSRQAISKWETDQSAPELEKLMALAELFSVSTDELLGRKVPQKETQPETAKKPDGADALTRAAFSRRCLTLGCATARRSWRSKSEPGSIPTQCAMPKSCRCRWFSRSRVRWRCWDWGLCSMLWHEKEIKIKRTMGDRKCWNLI